MESTTERIAESALDQFSEVGIRRTTVEDVAKRAGLSRVTVYRNVGGKDDLVRLVIEREAQRAMEDFEVELSGIDDPGLALERSFAAMVSFVRDHPLFDRLLRTEPEALLPMLTVNGGPFLAFYRQIISTQMEVFESRGLIAPVNLDRAAEATARMAISLVLTPSGLIEANDPVEVAAFAREILLPMMYPR